MTAFSVAAIAVFTAFPSFAQDSTFIDKTKIPETAVSPRGFVPAGWKIEEDVTGDLNGDGVADHAIKLIEDKPATAKDDTMIERSRALIIAIADKNGGLRKAAVADKLLQCATCGGAFYGVSEAPANVSIKKGVIIVEQDYGSRWVTDMTFRFRFDTRSGKFDLIGFDFSSRDRAAGGGATESTNYLTGTRITTVDKGKRSSTKTTKIATSRVGIEDVDKDKFDEDANKRLGLD